MPPKSLLQTKLTFAKTGELAITATKSSNLDCKNPPNKKQSKEPITNPIKPAPLPSEYRPPKDLNQYCAPLPTVPPEFNIRSKLIYLDNLLASLIQKANARHNKVLANKIESHYAVLHTPDARLLISLFQRDIPPEERYYKRLATEFRLVIGKQFVKVFIQVLDILAIASRLGIPHIIRGSAGSSLICYLLKITDIDPIQECISLARFMHTQRDDLPDIDMDFPSNRRDEIYTEIFRIYGNRVARISNHVKYSEKTALKKAIKDTTHTRGAIPKDFDLMDYVPDIMTAAQVLQRADELEGQFKHYSLHCGGIIIFDKPIPQEYILEVHNLGNARMPEVEWSQVSLNKDQVDDYMFIKIDILSNRGLTELWDIDTRDIESYPYDTAVYESLSRGENIGIVYAESRAMRKALICLAPNDIQGIALALAIIRPVAREHKSAYFKDYNDYKAIKEDQTQARPVDNPRPVDDGVRLSDYIIYDDDAIQLIQRLLGCTEADADVYRKAFAKGKRWKMTEFENRLRTARKDFPEEKIRLIYDQLCNLQAYSFCKSHAISYAKLVYALAYNKVYNPVEFWISALNNCNSSYRRWVYYREAVAIGIKLTRGMAPWRYDDKLQSLVSIPVFEGIKKLPFSDEELEQMNNCSLEIEDVNRLEYFRLGYWCDETFIAGCYLKRDNTPTKKKRRILEEDVYLWRFKGLISNYRCCKTWKTQSTPSDGNGNGNSNPKRERNITFVTIGYDNGQYIDIVLYGKIGLGKCHVIEGYGEMQDENHAQWIKVDKWNTARI